MCLGRSAALRTNTISSRLITTPQHKNTSVADQALKSKETEKRDQAPLHINFQQTCHHVSKKNRKVPSLRHMPVPFQPHKLRTTRHNHPLNMIGRSIAPKQNSYILRATLGQFWACVTAFALNVPSACFFLSVLCAPDQYCSCNTVPTLDPLKPAISIYRDLLMSSASQLRPGQCPPVSSCLQTFNMFPLFEQTNKRAPRGYPWRHFV